MAAFYRSKRENSLQYCDCSRSEGRVEPVTSRIQSGGAFHSKVTSCSHLYALERSTSGCRFRNVVCQSGYYFLHGHLQVIEKKNLGDFGLLRCYEVALAI